MYFWCPAGIDACCYEHLVVNSPHPACNTLPRHCSTKPCLTSWVDSVALRSSPHARHRSGTYRSFCTARGVLSRAGAAVCVSARLSPLAGEVRSTNAHAAVPAHCRRATARAWRHVKRRFLVGACCLALGTARGRPQRHSMRTAPSSQRVNHQPIYTRHVAVYHIHGAGYSCCTAQSATARRLVWSEL